MPNSLAPSPAESSRSATKSPLIPASPVVVSALPADLLSSTPAIDRGHDAHHDHDGNRFTLAKVDWSAAIPIGLLHLACLAAPFTFSWSGVGIAAFMWWVTGGLGICLCYHRLLTHRSFKTPKWFEYFLTVLGASCWQGGPIKWVGEHRIHHQHSDGDHDPHSPKHGFNWAHVLWCVTKSPEGYKPREAAKDLQRDPVLVMIDTYHYVWQFAIAAVVSGAGYAVGGWTLALSWFIWGIAVRTVITYHSTWFVNSASHTWGYKNYKTSDDSRNNWWVALLAFGEGWHNNHHHSQRSAAHGHKWYEFDLTYQTIRLLSLVGLARDIVRVKH